MNQNKKNSITMLDRTMQILNFLCDYDSPAGISDIASALQLPKATVFRILNTLKNWDMVESINHGEGYKLGYMLIKLGHGAENNMHLVDVCKPIMERISAKVNESVNLGIICENSILSVYNTEAPTSVLSSKQMVVSPLYCSSAGKAHLTYLSDEKLSEYFSGSALTQRTENTITTLDGFLKERNDIRESGLAYDREEYEIGLSCIATSIFNRHGKILAALSISGPTTRMKTKEDIAIHLLKQAKLQLENYTYNMEYFDE